MKMTIDPFRVSPVGSVQGERANLKELVCGSEAKRVPHCLQGLKVAEVPPEGIERRRRNEKKSGGGSN